jgi:hypothetical protein
MQPQWRAVAAPAASGSGPPAPPPYRREVAPPPPMLDAFRCAAARGATPPQMAHGGPPAGGFVFQPRGGAAKRLRFTDEGDAHSPAGSVAASMRSLGGVRFAPGMLPQGALASSGRAIAVPSAPLPPPPPVPAAALRATPEAKQKLQELLKKMDPRRGGGGKPRAARHL